MVGLTCYISFAKTNDSVCFVNECKFFTSFMNKICENPVLKVFAEMFVPSEYTIHYLCVCVCALLFFYSSRDHVPLGSLIFSSEDNETAIPGGSCSQSLYCGPFRSRTASFAILPDEESDSCGVLCELFYIIFSSAIGLPLIFCLM